jgi:succinyl-CoA:acetate CoA-transferase
MPEAIDRTNGEVPLRSAPEAAAMVPADAGLAVSGFGGVGYPKAVPLALAEGGRDLSLSIVSGGGVGAEIDTALIEAEAIERRYPFQADARIREAINERSVAFHDRHISRLGDEVEFGGLLDVDTAIVEAVAVGPDWLVPSTSIGLTPSFVAAADELIVEVNREQPLALRRMHDVYRRSPPPNREPIPLTEPGGRIGTNRIEFPEEKLVGVVETAQRDDPYTFREPTETYDRIAGHLARFLEKELEANPVFDDRICLQFGVGNLGNAISEALTRIEFGDTEVAYFGEVFQDGLLELLDDGTLESASATSLALSADGQNRLFDDIERYTSKTVVRNADVSNSPELIRRFGVVGINSAVDVDVYGNANSTHIGGTRVVNGIGGSGDFNRNAIVSVVALPATAGGGDISRVLPLVRHVDHTEHDVDVFITEHGVADVRGCSPVERAETIVERCADPRFRPALEAYLERAREGEGGGHHPLDVETVFEWERLG